jgi:hypothetical protein
MDPSTNIRMVVKSEKLQVSQKMASVGDVDVERILPKK